jgi:cell division septation protein DedD
MSQGQQSTARAQSEAGSETVEDPSMQAPRRSGPTVSIPRIIAGALAAASGAFASSWLGLAGTVTGAIVVSVIVSVGTAVYTPPVERSHQVIQRGSRMVLETLPVPPHNRGSTYVGDDLVTTRTIPAEPGSSDPAAGNAKDAPDRGAEPPSEPPAAEPVDREDQSPTQARGASRRGRFAWSDVPRHWRRIVATTAAILVAGFAVLTGFELAVGRSAESITGGGGGGTTLGHLVPGHTGSAPATTPSSRTPSSPTPSSATPSATAPSTTTPTTTTPTSTAPSTGTPSSTPTSTTPRTTQSTP